MYRKKLIQKLQQLIDKLPACVKREHIMQDLIDLKLSKSDYHYVSLKNKYKDEEISKSNVLEGIIMFLVFSLTLAMLIYSIVSKLVD